MRERYVVVKVSANGNLETVSNHVSRNAAQKKMFEYSNKDTVHNYFLLSCVGFNVSHIKVIDKREGQNFYGALSEIAADFMCDDCELRIPDEPMYNEGVL